MACLKAGRVNVNKLRFCNCLNTGDAMARGLRLTRSNAHLGADQRIHQCRLSDIGTPYNRDVSASKIGWGFRRCHAVLECVTEGGAAASDGVPEVAC